MDPQSILSTICEAEKNVHVGQIFKMEDPILDNYQIGNDELWRTTFISAEIRAHCIDKGKYLPTHKFELL
jgi:hypothetical protein